LPFSDHPWAGAAGSTHRSGTLGGQTGVRYDRRMDFDQLLVRFFGTDDFTKLSPERLVEGVEALRLQFGLERDAGRRFALWCLMYMLDIAPDLEDAFEDEDDREAARDFMDTADREMSEDEGEEDGA
jgi:hypothetical protein